MNIEGFIPKNNIFLAPMAGVTDKSFRILCREFECGLVYTEMISSKGLHYGSKKTEVMFNIDEREEPAAVQIFGSDPEIMGQTAEIISEKKGVGLIDINMGCPAPKIVKNIDGSALMREPLLAEKIIKNVVQKSKRPVTVKIRKGWDENSVNAVEFAKMIEASGASAVAVHGRTRSQFYDGKADWDIIRKVKEALKIPVIGNGDVVSPEDAKRLFDFTGCDAIMIGRGALGNPWIFKRTVHYLETGELLPEPTAHERIDMAIRHLDMVLELKGHRAIIEMRKHIAWYLKGVKNAAAIRDAVNKITTRDELVETLLKHRNEVDNI